LQGSVEGQSKIAFEADEICKNLGFLIVEQDGIPRQVIDGAWFMTPIFFDLPVDQELSSKPPIQGCPHGYFPMQSEALVCGR
jgi:isopenicillin N synthase-like dioxygenase